MSPEKSKSGAPSEEAQTKKATSGAPKSKASKDLGAVSSSEITGPSSATPSGGKPPATSKEKPGQQQVNTAQGGTSKDTAPSKDMRGVATGKITEAPSAASPGSKPTATGKGTPSQQTGNTAQGGTGKDTAPVKDIRGVSSSKITEAPSAAPPGSAPPATGKGTPSQQTGNTAQGGTAGEAAHPLSPGEARSDEQHKPTSFLTELPIATALHILVIWLPRFFIPWIITWQEFSFFILSNPGLLEDWETAMLIAKFCLLLEKAFFAIASSYLVDCILGKYDWKYCIYLILLAVFTFSPIVGGFSRAETAKRTRGAGYGFFTMFVVTELMISVSFVMFPVQMACIYAQNNWMSRNGHYLWASLFVLIEFVNANIAFHVIPVQCPTHVEDKIYVIDWVAMFPVLVLVLVLTVVFTVKDIKVALLNTFKKNTEIVHKPDADQTLDPPADLKKKKLGWFVLVMVPVVSSYFSFSVLERFVPNYDWNDRPSSALSVYLWGKIFGVIVLMAAMHGVERFRKGGPHELKWGMLYLGLPHALNALALVILVARLASLDHTMEGDVILGPIPNEEKTVFVFVNSMPANRTVCVSSKFFEKFRLRPHQLVTRDVYDPKDVQGLIMTFTLEPCSSPCYRQDVVVKDVYVESWKIYDVALFPPFGEEDDDTDNIYITNVLETAGMSPIPKVGSSHLVIFSVVNFVSPEPWFYRLKHSTGPDIMIPVELSSWSSSAWANEIVWRVPATGKWRVDLWSTLFNQSARASKWVATCIKCIIPLEFYLGDNSFYLLLEYFYEEADPFSINISSFENPPEDRFPGIPLAYKLYKLGELAGPNDDHVPSNEQLQSDWAVLVSMAFAGMAAGGMFSGFIYLFWVNPPLPRYRTVTLAVVWGMMGIAAGIPRIVVIEVNFNVSIILLMVQLLMTALHVVGSFFMLVPELDFFNRP